MVITSMALNIAGGEGKQFPGVASGFKQFLEQFANAAASNAVTTAVFRLEDGNEVRMTFDVYREKSDAKAFGVVVPPTYHLRPAEQGKWDDAVSVRFTSADVAWGILRFLNQDKRRIGFQLNSGSGVRIDLKFQVDGDILNLWTCMIP
jgi:hypothetical protein